MSKNYELNHEEVKKEYPLTIDGALTITGCVFGSGFSFTSLLVMPDQYLSLMDDVLESLNPVDNLVLRMRFNSSRGYSHTLEEIGVRLGVTRERVRQIQVKALRKMRHPSRGDKLFESFEHSQLE